MAAPLPPFSAQVGDARYACLDMRPRSVRALTLSCVGVERCLPAYRIDRPGYACHVLEFVSEGSGTLVLAGEKHALHPGACFTYGPGVPHRIESDPRRPLRKFFADFFGHETLPLLRRAGVEPPFFGRPGHAAELATLFEELLRDASSAGPHHAEIAAARLRVLLLKAGKPASADRAEDDRARATLRRALDVIETRHASLASLGDIARAANVDPSHLCRLFARFRGDSPRRHLTRRKLAAAARLLTSGDVLVKHAAAAAGFPDALHFSRLFARDYGCSPSEFRRRRAEAAARAPRK